MCGFVSVFVCVYVRDLSVSEFVTRLALMVLSGKYKRARFVNAS